MRPGHLPLNPHEFPARAFPVGGPPTAGGTFVSGSGFRSDSPEPGGSMSSRFLKRIEQIFDAVADLSDEKRQRVLDEMCGDDAELRREVECILAADSSPDPGFRGAVIWERANEGFDVAFTFRCGGNFAHRPHQKRHRKRTPPPDRGGNDGGS